MLLIRLVIWLISLLIHWGRSSSSSNYTATNMNYDSVPHVNCPFCGNQMYAVANICSQCGRNRQTGQYGA